MRSRVYARGAAVAVLLTVPAAPTVAQTSLTTPWVSQSVVTGAPGVLARYLSFSPSGDVVAASYSPDGVPITRVAGDSTLGSIVIVKMSAAGKLAFALQLGGVYAVYTVAAGSDGNVYVAGLAATSGLPVSTSAYRLAPAGDHTPYLCKLSGIDGSPLFCTYLNDNLMQLAPSLGVDAAGNIYLAAQRGESTLAATPGAVSVGNRQVMVMKFNANGSRLLFAAEFGGSGTYDAPVGLMLDTSGAINVLVQAWSPDFPGSEHSPIAAPPASSSFGAPVVAKLSADGTHIVYAVYGRTGESELDIAVSSAGEVHLLAAPFLNPDNARHALVRKYTADGAGIAYETQYAAGTGPLFPRIAVDDQGMATVVDINGSISLPIHHATASCAAPEGTNAYLVRLSPTGEIVQTTFLAAAGPVDAVGLNIRSSGGYVAEAVTTREARLLGIVHIVPDATGSAETALGCYGNGADFRGGPLAPGEIFSLFGEGLGPDTGVPLAGARGGPVVSSLGGVTVTFDGTPAPLLYVQSAQVNAIAPWNLAGKTATELCVSYGGRKSCTSVAVSPAAPGIFQYPVGPYDTLTAAAVNEDGTLNSPEHPAAYGSVVSLYATGLGAISPVPIDGTVVEMPLPALSSQAQVFFVGPAAGFGGTSIPATVTYAGPAPFEVGGMYQINVQVPERETGVAGAVMLTVKAPDGSTHYTPFVPLAIP